MKKLMACSLVAARLLGALLSLFALFVAAFASDSGAQDPMGARVSALMIWVPVVFVVCLVASSVLMRAQRGNIALTVSGVPILYFITALLISG